MDRRGSRVQARRHVERVDRVTRPPDRGAGGAQQVEPAVALVDDRRRGGRRPSPAPIPTRTAPRTVSVAGYGSCSPRRSPRMKSGRLVGVRSQELLRPVDARQHDGRTPFPRDSRRGCRCRVGRRRRVDARRRSVAAPPRRSGVSGLPATSGKRPTAVCTADTRVPLPGAMPRSTRDRPVHVRRDPRDAAGLARAAVRVQRERRLGELAPPDLGREALHDGVGAVVGRAGHAVAAPLELGRDPLAAHDEHERAVGHLAPRAATWRPAARSRHPSGTTSRPSSARCCGDGCIAARRVVRDVADGALAPSRG